MRRLDNFRIGSGRDFLEEGALQRLPSIMAEHKIPTASRNYNLFSTSHMVDVLDREGWKPTFAQEQNARGERVGYQKHLIRFRQPGLVMKNVGDVAPELLMTNSHDTTAAFILMAGLFKLACLNGLIVCQTQFDSVHIRHVGWQEQDVIEATSKVSKAVPMLAENVQNYRQIQLDAEEQRLFAEEALMIKFRAIDVTPRKDYNDQVMIGDRGFSISTLLRPTRDVDKEPTLWNTFNVVQEKLIKGNNFERTTRRLTDGRTTNTTRVREIGAIDEGIRVNMALWTLMETFRKFKQA